MARATKPKPRELPPEAIERRKMLMDAGYRAIDVWRHLSRKGRSGISLRTVYSVIDGEFRNDDVISAFCSLVNAPAAKAFPE